MTILVTGATGFVGTAVCQKLNQLGTPIIAAVRDKSIHKNIGQVIEVGSICAETDWSIALSGVSVVLHLAARVHIMSDNAPDPLAEFRRTNLGATINLARQAACSGVKRFLFVSTIKVNGEETCLGQPFSADQPPNPCDAYAISKLEAEVALQNIAKETGMEVVIIRPPLIYGKGVKANFARMVNLVARGLPLPFLAIKKNRRSLISLDNLTDFLIVCSQHPRAANEIFLVSDGEDLSTADLLERIGRILNKPARLFYVPLFIIKLIFLLFRNKGIYRRVCCSLQIDIEKNNQLLSWTPKFSVTEGLNYLTGDDIASKTHI
jgi:nucleoside-diphosphate-sugar epimerase